MYVVTEADRLRGVRRADGQVAWTVALPGDFRKKLNEYAVVGRGRLVLPTTDGNVLVVRTSDRRPMWRRLDHVGVSVRPAVEDGTVYLNGRTLDARRISDGKAVWSAELDEEEAAADEWGQPVVSGEAVYAVGGVYPRRLDKSNGEQVWRGYHDAYTASSLLVQGHGVWSVVTDDNRADELVIATVTTADGEWAWRYSSLPLFEYRLRMAADGNRAFCMSDSSVIALACF